MNETIRVGDLDVPVEKAEVVLELFFSLLLKGYPWVSSEAKIKNQKASEAAVPQSLRSLPQGASSNAGSSLQTSSVQFMVVKYIDPTFEIPPAAAESVTKYAYTKFITWWVSTPDDFREATEGFVTLVKLNIFGDHDESNILDGKAALI